MNSAKTLNLLAVAHCYRQQGKRVFLVKPKTDTRSDGDIATRCGLRERADLVVAPGDSLSLEQGAPPRHPGNCVRAADRLSRALVRRRAPLDGGRGLDRGDQDDLHALRPQGNHEPTDAPPARGRQQRAHRRHWALRTRVLSALCRINNEQVRTTSFQSLGCISLGCSSARRFQPPAPRLSADDFLALATGLPIFQTDCSWASPLF